MEVSARDARRRFSERPDLGKSGEEIIVTQHGKPAVRLVAERDRRARRPLPGYELLGALGERRDRSAPSER